MLGVRNETYYNNAPLFRKALSKTFRWCMSVSLKLKSDDTQCGIKGFSKAGKELFLKTEINRFLFDLEFVLYASRKKQILLKKEPVTLKEGVVFSKMPLKVLAGEMLNFIKILLK